MLGFSSFRPSCIDFCLSTHWGWVVYAWVVWGKPPGASRGGDRGYYLDCGVQSWGRMGRTGKVSPAAV